jgi:hypothetical protein
MKALAALKWTSSASTYRCDLTVHVTGYPGLGRWVGTASGHDNLIHFRRLFIVSVDP